MSKSIKIELNTNTVVILVVLIIGIVVILSFINKKDSFQKNTVNSTYITNQLKACYSDCDADAKPAPTNRSGGYSSRIPRTSSDCIKACNLRWLGTDTTTRKYPK